MEMLKGKNVLLIGATGGIGSSTARLIKASGANLFIAARDNEKLQLLAGELSISTHHLFALDISNAAAVEQLKQHFFAQFNSIDILINTAGIGIIKPVAQLTQVDFLHSLHCNLVGPFLLIKAFLPSMQASKKGLIINVPGILGKVPMSGAAAYSASKYGLLGMLQSLREEIKRTEIRITNLFIGGVDTNFWNEIDLKVQRDKMITAQEAAKSIWFLCQQPASGVVSEMVIQPFNHQVI
jgi:short-subunit dehydrogenase